MAFIEPGLFDMIVRLRGRGISDNNVLRAMEQIKRSDFVPDDLVPESYDEKFLPLPCGQSLTSPMTTAILCQTLDVRPAHKILLIGAGSGYSSAILAKICKRVYAVERYKTLVEYAEQRLRKQAARVVLRHADGRLGWRGQAPFERILITADVRVIPTALQNQLTPDGRVVAAVNGVLTRAEFVGKMLKETPILPLDLPPMQAGKSSNM